MNNSYSIDFRIVLPPHYKKLLQFTGWPFHPKHGRIFFDHSKVDLHHGFKMGHPLYAFMGGNDPFQLSWDIISIRTKLFGIEIIELHPRTVYTVCI